MQYAHYLIVEKNIVPKEYFRFNLKGDKIPHTIVGILRKWTPQLNSIGYKMKMEIIEELKAQGIDYFSTEILDDIIIWAKKFFGNMGRISSKILILIQFSIMDEHCLLFSDFLKHQDILCLWSYLHMASNVIFGEYLYYIRGLI